ncbi:MAG: UDP-3-O-(3-hydroxymyristoyl)glucosamine N-acyltransferase [Chitinispirillales bacterium]|jgi:UDP-3-O-[3-hydroxymyristoyl] glucosamine N-acyltransferase|nr:UDP-3-O-(3-hydroxymyristoyl)glucosamine N-acyltransferase [Chitinispirillales bacterium]
MKLSEIAAHIGAAFSGSSGEDIEISGISSPGSASPDKITFVSDAKYLEQGKASSAGAIIVKKGCGFSEKPCLEVDDPYLGYAQVAQLFEDITPLFGEGIHKSAIIDESAVIDKSSSIGPMTVIGANVRIGAHCRVDAHCVIERDVTIGKSVRIDSGAIIRYGVQIGSQVIIQSGAVVGSDGFGNARDKDSKFIRIPCFGTVLIEDGVEIGAGVTIDRGNFEPTIIGKGVKLDNLVHIAHNVTIGENTAIAAQTGISGSTQVGKRVIIAGQVGFVGHINIGDDSFVGAKAGVSKDVDVGARVTGYPARDLMTVRRIEASSSQLPELLKEVKKLRTELNALAER